MDALEILKTVWPIILIQVAFQIYALVDLFAKKKGKAKNLPAAAWAVIILIGGVAGPAVYFLLGRGEE